MEALGGGAQAELSPGVEAVGASTQSGLHLLESDVSGVAADGGETPDSAGEVGVSFPTGYIGGEEQAGPLLGPDTVGVWSRGEPPLLVAAATAVSVVKEGSVPRVCVTPLLAKAGVDSKEAEGRPGCVESSNIVNNRRREEDRCLLLHYDVSSAIKEVRVLKARSGLIFRRLRVI